MTTVYVNHGLGVVMTDTRTTTTMVSSFLGLIPVGTYDVYNDNGVKAINVHDRIFVESGSCSESDKILQYLTTGKPIVPAHKKHKLISCCFLVDKNWTLHITINKGVLRKKFYVVDKGSWYSFGSGGEAMKQALAIYGYKPTMEQAIAAFKTVHFSDRFTSSQVQIYNI